MLSECLTWLQNIFPMNTIAKRMNSNQEVSTIDCYKTINVPKKTDKDKIYDHLKDLVDAITP